MAIDVVNESSRSISQADLATFASILQGYADLVDKVWSVNAGQVLSSATRGAGWNVCIVDKFPNPAMQKVALGYHEVVNGQPIAYIRADAYGSRSIFGVYTPAFKLKNIQIHGERFTPGLITVAAHELAEMIIDPQVTRVSAPDNAIIPLVCSVALLRMLARCCQTSPRHRSMTISTALSPIHISMYRQHRSP